MKKPIPLYLRVTDESNDFISATAGAVVPKTAIASAILESAIEALRKSGRPFTLPVRFLVDESLRDEVRAGPGKQKAA